MREGAAARDQRGRRRGRRGLSGLGLLLVLAGVVLAMVGPRLPAPVLAWWPLVPVAVGLLGLLRPAGLIEELDRRAAGPLVVTGLAALAFTLGLTRPGLVGPAVIAGLGLLLAWWRLR